MSSFDRLLNQMIPSLGVQDNQLRPDTSYVKGILNAAHDIRLCKEIFDGWTTHLDKCVQRRLLIFCDGPNFCRLEAEKPDEREREVRQYLAWLAESARKCSEDTDNILRFHAHFASLMAWQIDVASRSSQKGPDYGTDTRRLADVIGAASRSLSQDVVKMKSDLDKFVSYLENMQVKEEHSMAHRILGWLKHLFNALAAILALWSLVAPFVAPGTDAIVPAASALCLAAAELCKKGAGTSLGMPVSTSE